MDKPLTEKAARMEAAQIDFQQLRIKHILYKSKVRSVLYGGAFDEAFFTPSGPVGHWFNEIGLVRYGQQAEIRELFQLHQQLNSSALQLIGMYRRGQIDQAHTDMRILEEHSGQFLAALSRLEQRLT
jgi:hypothetical protein